MSAELRSKLARVRRLLQREGAEAALLGLQPNFSWLAGGGEAHIPLNSDRSFGQLLVTRRDFFVFANRIEMDRLQAEVVKNLGAKPLLWEWHDSAGALRLLKQIASPKHILSDCGDWGTPSRPELFAPLRYSLQPAEVRRYRALGRAAEAALNQACRALQPGQTEFEIAGALAERAWERNLTPVVLLVAADERIRRFRHPLPTRRKLRRHALLVLCARQHGLIVALTRIVHFGALPAELRRRHDANCAVDAAFQLATRVGARVRDVFQAGVAEYARQNFPDEWHLHHQGGPCGYQGRDYLGSPDVAGTVRNHQPFAWNPSITGTKCEDTILATKRGPQVITAAQDWPMVSVEWQGKVWPRPDILVR